MSYEFTSESVSEGHPDKIADQISDRVADYIIAGNSSHRAAVETLVTTNMVTLAGEYKSSVPINKEHIEEIVRGTVREIGYEQQGFHWENLKIYNELHGQSPDIALGTDDFGAGDHDLCLDMLVMKLRTICCVIHFRIEYKALRKERQQASWIDRQ